MIYFSNPVYPSPDTWRAVVRGMRNPKNSWDKGDSFTCVPFEFSDADIENCSYKNCTYYIKSEDGGFSACEATYRIPFSGYVLGENDLKLMKILCQAGSPEHAKFLRQLPIIIDITAPLYWWPQCDQYKIGTVTNSCSRMHKLLAKPFELSDFSFEHTPGYRNIVKQEYPDFTDEELENEEWVELDTGYSISNLGRVKGILKEFIKPPVTKDGYCSVYMIGKRYRLSRLVAEHFCDKSPEATVVNHIDGNKLDNRASNLEWVTQKENIEHSRENNLQPKPTKFYKGKFTEEERAEILEQWNTGNYSKRQLAEMWNVSHTCINDMLNKKHQYRDLPDVFNDDVLPLIDKLNELRDLYFAEENSKKKKDIWYTILELLPQSYMQKRTWSANYEVLRNICKQRKGHPLQEWADFIEFVHDSVPFAKQLIFNEWEDTE